MTARQTEAEMLKRCTAAARGSASLAHDRQEANVFRLAAMVVQPRHPDESSRLMHASDDYFSLHPSDRVTPAEVLRQGWLISLPRLRDMLSRELR